MASKDRVTSLELLALAWSLGWRIAAGVLVGYFLDEWLGTGPLLTLLFSLAALIAGVLEILQVLREGARRPRESR